MAGKYGVLFTLEELEWLAGLLAERKGATNYDIYVKVTDVLETIPVDERKN